MKKRRSTPIPLQITGRMLSTLLTDGSFTFLAARISREDGIEDEDCEDHEEQDKVEVGVNTVIGTVAPVTLLASELARERLLDDEIHRPRRR